MDYKPEGKNENYPKWVSLETTEEIMQQMKTKICKIYLKNGKKGTGFFCKILLSKKIKTNVLITCNHIIDEKVIENKEEITLEINSVNEPIRLKLKNILIYTNDKYDITIIEIKKDDKINCNYFEFENNKYIEKNIKESIYILHYPGNENISVSYGIIDSINSIDEYEFIHYCSTDNGSSGSPIINLKNKNIIGIHKGANKGLKDKYNLGIFLKFPIDEYIQQNYKEKYAIEFNKKFKMNINTNIKKLDLGNKENKFESEISDYNLIDNNIEINKGIIQLVEEYNNNIKIKKKLLVGINCFISCLGPPGSGKSTFCSNYYKRLYKVKYDYFKSSDNELTFTKGIWMISDAERRKIPINIKKDILDVEGFQVDDIKSWKYIMIIAFLSTDLIILNRNPRFGDVRKMLKIIESSLKKMRKMNIIRLLKVIYIQTNKDPNKQKPIEKLLEDYQFDKNAFEGIKFKYLYLPSISPDELENEKDLMHFSNYRNKFDEILNLLISTNYYNSASSLMDWVDMFNETINGNSGFNVQTILKELESDFNGVYNRYENKIKNELSQKINKLKKLESINETFDQFIKKQNDLNFKFEIKNEDLTFYGGNEYFNNYYEKLKKNKTFKIEPKDIFFNFYNNEKIKLEIAENMV